MRVSSYPDVHLCICLLLEKKQSICHFRGKARDYTIRPFILKYYKIHSLQDNQKDLETATEQLSEYLERDISAENLVDIKQKVQDKYR